MYGMEGEGLSVACISDYSARIDKPSWAGMFRVVDDYTKRRLARSFALALTSLRLALGPIFIIIVGTLTSGGPLAAALLAIGFASDYFDGVVARRYGVASAGLRRYDSASDTVFYLGAAFAAWRMYPDAIGAHAVGIVLVLGTQALDHAVELAKFRREAAYHAWTAKIWGLMLAAALFTLFATGVEALLGAAIVCGLCSHVENLAITLLLPSWRHDVPSVVHAARLRARQAVDR